MRPHPKVMTACRGFTLIELLVSLLMVSVSMTALLSFFQTQNVSIQVENSRRAAQMTARSCLAFIVRHLENIGRDPTLEMFSAAAPAIETAELDDLHYQTNLSDDDPNGVPGPDTADDWEDVTFIYDDIAQAIMVTIPAVGGGGTETYALTDDGVSPQSYVPSGGLTFTYYDEDGNIIPPGGGVTDRGDIRRINVAVTVRGLPPGGHAEPEVTLAQDVFLRNMS